MMRKKRIFIGSSSEELGVANYDQNIVTDNNKANDIFSVDRRKYVFKNKSAKIENLKLLLAEIVVIIFDLKYLMNV